MQLSGTEHVAGMKDAIDGLMHQTEAIFVTDWMAGDVADAVNMVGYSYRSDPSVQVYATVRRVAHNKSTVTVRILAPTNAKMTSVSAKVNQAAEAAIRRSTDEMKRSGFSNVKAAL